LKIARHCAVEKMNGEKLLYRYDIHGNVDTLLQDYKTGSMNSSVNRFKKFIYSYDLISGKVNTVDYQPGQADAFYHKYSYDAENRLTKVETSNDKIVWERDAAYDYYRHGPLARMELGNNRVQGTDYAYTLQGWLKGINSTAVSDGSFDMGKDGKAGSANSPVARDVFGMGLNYFSNDYKTISNAATPFAGITVGADLFNGNIKAMLVNTPKLGNAITYGFKYDQLNRLLAQDAYTGLTNATNIFTQASITDYKEQLTYDPNGNIKTYLRNGTGSSLSLNNYAYTYTANTNRLASITNSVTTLTKTYAYDNIGNATADGMQGVTNAVWNLYGKLQSCTNSAAQAITYTYSADGQRISKKVGTTEEWYVRDASGNVMATYIKDATVNSGHVSTSEFYKYGSSLLGTLKKVIDVEVVAVTNGLAAITRGETEYLLTDYRGNNMAAISDKIVQHTTDGSTVDYYLADVRTATFYSAYGAIANSYNGANIKLAHNGQRRSLEISTSAQTAEFWEYNSDVGRRNNLDPVVKEYESPYLCFNGNPIANSDADGDDAGKPKKKVASAEKVEMYQSVMTEAEKKMNGLAAQIKNYQVHIDEMKSLMNQQVMVDLSQSFNPFSFIPQGATDLLNGGSSVDYMAATIANRVGEMANLVSKYNDAYNEYKYAASAMKLEFKDATHFDIGGGVVLQRLSGTQMAGMAATMHKNSSAAEGSFALYEISIDGTMFKYGLADAGRLRKGGDFAGLPERLAQQLSKINKYAPELDVVGKVRTILQTSKAEMIILETKTIIAHAKQLGVPIGNVKEIKMWAELYGKDKLAVKAVQALSKFLKL
jgi:hypothetical protein